MVVRGAKKQRVVYTKWLGVQKKTKWVEKGGVKKGGVNTMVVRGAKKQRVVYTKWLGVQKTKSGVNTMVRGAKKKQSGLKKGGVNTMVVRGTKKRQRVVYTK
jgi:hypothetical protein